MKIFTKEILAQLAANGKATRDEQEANGREIDHKPVLKIFSPVGAATWLITESDPDEPDRLFGLCDLGFGTPELGYVARSEIEETRVTIRVVGLGRGELPLERDLYFKPDYPLSVYTKAARTVDRITESATALKQAAKESTDDR